MAGKENSQHKDPPLALKQKQQTTHPEQAETGKTPFPVERTIFSQIRL